MSAIRSIAELEQAAREAGRKNYLQVLQATARELRKTMQCNCDLDNWEPEMTTGHSWVCRIHKATIAAVKP